MKKLLLASALLAASFSASSAMAVPVDYTFNGSNNPQNVETPGSLTGAFTLDGGAWSSFSFTMKHAGIEKTFASDSAGLGLEEFSWTMDGSDIASIVFDADIGSDFLYLVWDITKDAMPRNDIENANRYEYSDNGLKRVFLDNANVSVSAVPEPASLALLGLGLAGLGLSRRKTKA